MRAHAAAAAVGLCVCDDVSAGGARAFRCHGDRCSSIDGCHGDDNFASFCVSRLAGVCGRTRHIQSSSLSAVNGGTSTDSVVCVSSDDVPLSPRPTTEDTCYVETTPVGVLRHRIV